MMMVMMVIEGSRRRGDKSENLASKTSARTIGARTTAQCTRELEDWCAGGTGICLRVFSASQSTARLPRQRASPMRRTKMAALRMMPTLRARTCSP